MSLYTYKCRVSRVIDGDTVVADIDLGFHIAMQRVVRLLDYNAPEIGGHAKTPEELAEGKRAAANLSELVTGHDLIVQTRLDRTDKYGRVLGRFWRDEEDILSGVSINGLMISYLANPVTP